MSSQHRTPILWTTAVIGWVALLSTLAIAQPPLDPGPRGGAAGAGGKIPGLTLKEGKFFDAGLDEFEEIASADGSVPGTEEGLGPRFNMIGCATCHAQPAVGGTSPSVNPQVNKNAQLGLVNPAPQSQIDLLTGLLMIKLNGPVREARFTTNNGKPDGGVHDLFTIVGTQGAPGGCAIQQPDFTLASQEGRLKFRIPTPTFGLGLIEAIEDATILANDVTTIPPPPAKLYDILGNANRNGNDGTVTRFGWKAQNKSLVIFSGEAYNVEQGITNELFPDERGEGGKPDPVVCRQVVPAPQDLVHYELTNPLKVIDNVNAFANFMRFLAPPTQVTSYTTPSGPVTSGKIALGEAAFNKAGCNVCHIKQMATGNHATAALRGKNAILFSDLLLHDVGTGDDIGQGDATGAQFRTAPLWGVGQRLFFMHDGSAEDLVSAILAHGGEAAPVILNFRGLSLDSHNLTGDEPQNLIYFLRSL